ncbi:MAG: protein phosphatase 2C domain-containing protein, partial [Clostridia bacterium]|nr:protein phosphatase 2C domain-containing protein [Clostridia bacterium]
MIIINCNLQGRKHQSLGAPCEDGFYTLTAGGVTAFALADGAGSSKYPNAKAGADTVTKAICEFFTARFDEFFELCNELEMRKILSAVCTNALTEKAQAMGLDTFSTMASTLLAVAVKGKKVIACQIGDGLIGVKNAKGLEPVFLPQNGEFAGSTYFITGENSYQMLQIRKFFLDSISHFFLMSDGIEDYVFSDTTGKFETVMDSLTEFTYEANGSALLSDCIKNNIVDRNPMSDDCTMIIAAVSNETGPELKSAGAPLNPNIKTVTIPKITKPQEAVKPGQSVRQGQEKTAKPKLSLPLLISIAALVLALACTGSFLFGKSRGKKALEEETTVTTAVETQTKMTTQSETSATQAETEQSSQYENENEEEETSSPAATKSFSGSERPGGN